MPKVLLRAGLLTVLMCAVFVISVERSYAIDLVVNSLLDQSDVNPGDDICETAAGNGICTLRAAIEEINTQPAGPLNVNGITFTVAGTIPIGAPGVMAINRNVFIDAPVTDPAPGPDQGGAGSNPVTFRPDIEIDAMGSDVFIFNDANAEGSTIQGLAINNYGQNFAISINGVNAISIFQSFFGADRNGADDGVQDTAIEVAGGAQGTGIGALENSNIFVNHDDAAILIHGNSDQTIVAGNTIGTGPSMNTVQGNTVGIRVFDSTETQILGNRINNSNLDGIQQITGSGTVIQGNIIGLNLAGAAAGNGGDGINLIANFPPNAPNVIGTDGDGVADATEGNTIVASGPNLLSDGIQVLNSAAGSVQISGNYIGTTAGSVLGLGNARNGIIVGAIPANGGLIGSDNDGVSDDLETNYILQSGEAGIIVNGDNWTIRNNDIGIPPSGACPMAIPWGNREGISVGDGGAVSTVVLDLNYIGCHFDPANLVPENGPPNYALGLEFGAGGAGIQVIRNRLGFNRANQAALNATGLHLVGDGNPILIGSADPANGNFISGAASDNHTHFGGSAITFQNNHFGGTPDPNVVIRNANTNLTLQSDNNVVLSNIFEEPSVVAAPFVSVILEPGVPGATAQSNRISQNVFRGLPNSFAGILIDLVDPVVVGATPNDGIYLNTPPPQPNFLIDTPVFTGNQIDNVVGTITPPPLGGGTTTIEFYRVNSVTSLPGPNPPLAPGLPGGNVTYLTSLQTSAGVFNINLSAFANVGDVIAATQTDDANNDTSEFSDIITLVPPVAGGGGGRDPRVIAGTRQAGPTGPPSSTPPPLVIGGGSGGASGNGGTAHGAADGLLEQVAPIRGCEITGPLMRAVLGEFSRYVELEMSVLDLAKQQVLEGTSTFGIVVKDSSRSDGIPLIFVTKHDMVEYWAYHFPLCRSQFEAGYQKYIKFKNDEPIPDITIFLKTMASIIRDLVSSDLKALLVLAEKYEQQNPAMWYKGYLDFFGLNFSNTYARQPLTSALLEEILAGVYIQLFN